MRSILALVLLAAALPAATLAATSECDAARDALRAELDAAGLTRRAAELTRASVEACPHAAPTGAEPVLTADVQDEDPDAKALAPRVLARDCGFAGVVTAAQEDADVTAWETLLLAYTFPRYEHGPADVAYHPSLDLTVYRGQGEVFGVVAQSNWVGAVFLHGVEIPANGGANASSGCSPSNPDLCWGSGMATVTVPAVYTVSVVGQLRVC